MIDLRGKTILVTGGSRGIGAAIVRAVASVGAQVLLHYGHSRAKAEALQAEIGAATCHLIQADLSDTDASDRLWRSALERTRKVDALINNAGIYSAAPINMPIEAWKAAWSKELQINLMAAAELSRLAIQHFLEVGGGRIINVASRAAHRGETPDHWPYAASKAGLIAITKTIARGYAKNNVLAFAIAPGYTETEMAHEGLDEAGVARVLADIPLGAMARPEECGALAAFLCSDQVRHLTGATFDVNGASYVR